ncbi:MAG: HAD family hydrolase [Planctomycetota bacterium]|jgi:putative hydrolase of the HAD superfamily
MTSGTEIKAVIFDLGKVLVDFDWNIAVQRISPHTSLNEDEIIPRVTETDFVKLYEEGVIDCDDFALEIIQLLNADISIEEFVSFWSDIFIRRPEMENLFSRVKEKYPVAILSDTSPMHWNYISRNVPAIAHPDALILSYEVGTHKPDQKIYQQALNELNITAENAFFTDDLEVNIAGAKKAGIQAQQFTTPEKMIPKIEKLLTL